jgi:hypothetical protein
LWPVLERLVPAAEQLRSLRILGPDPNAPWCFVEEDYLEAFWLKLRQLTAL